MDNKTIFVKIYPKTNLVECPFCHKKDDFVEGEVLQWDDYVDIPMIWCWDCKDPNYNTSYSFIDPDLFDNYFESYYKLSDKRSYEEHEKMMDGLDENFYVSIPLLHIERICDANMLQYSSEVKLTDEEVIDILNNNYSEEVTNKYKLKKYNSDQLPDDLKVMNISLPVGSYRVETPLIKYPNNFSQAHDGITITCLVRMLDGSLRQVRYWGD